MENLPKGKEHFVLDNLKMVHYIVQKKMNVLPGNTNYDDYYQEGVLGLTLAAIRFDEDKGYKFITFAFPYIMGYIQKYKRSTESTVRCPRAIKDIQVEIARYTSQGYTLKEIENITGISGFDIQNAINMSSIVSLNQPVEAHTKEIEHTTVEDVLESSKNDYESIILRDQILKIAKEVSNIFKEPKQKELWEYYINEAIYSGVIPRQPHMSEKFGMSQSYVSRVIKKGKRKFIQLYNKY